MITPIEKMPQWFGKKWRILVGLFVFFIIPLTLIGYVWRQKSIQNDKIQAIAVIAFVFVTGYYAVQTYRLVKEQRKALEEERKRRYAEFDIQRIEKYLSPFLDMLRRLRDRLSYVVEVSKDPNSDKLRESLGMFQGNLDQIDDFVVKNLYMADPVLRLGFLKVTRKEVPKYVGFQVERDMKFWKEETEKDIDELINAVSSEISLNCQHIRKTYGFFSRDTKARESPDDLTVLSKRPPLRR